MMLHEEFTLHIRKCRLTWVIDILGPWELFMPWFPIAKKSQYRPWWSTYICQSTEWRHMLPWGTTNPLRSTESCWLVGWPLRKFFRLELPSESVWGQNFTLLRPYHTIVMYYHDSNSLFDVFCSSMQMYVLFSQACSQSLSECRRYPVVVDCHWWWYYSRDIAGIYKSSDVESQSDMWHEALRILFWHKPSFADKQKKHVLFLVCILQPHTRMYVSIFFIKGNNGKWGHFPRMIDAECNHCCTFYSTMPVELIPSLFLFLPWTT